MAAGGPRTASTGAAFAPGLALPPDALVVSKATEPDREAYSAFEGTDLAERLRAADVRRVFVGGLATDHCVLHTVRDALARGYETYVLADAIRPVDPEDGRRAEDEMVRRGAVMIRSEALAA